MTELSCNRLSPADAIQRLFGIKLSDFPLFKDDVNSLIRKKGFFKIYKERVVQREKVFIAMEELNKLHNAVLFQAFGLSPKRVVAIFSEKEHRQKEADLFSDLLFNRQSILGIGLLGANVDHFLSELKSDQDLSKVKLPNPFSELPQLVLSHETDVYRGLLVQSAVLNSGDSMMTSYMEGNLKKAYKQAIAITPDNEILVKYKDLIINEYKQAKEFDQTLENFFR